jgi:starch synthase
MDGGRRVLHVTSECAPLVKTGGLGDVVGALPAALRAMGTDARVLIPGYPKVLAAVGAERVVLHGVGPFGDVRVALGTLPHGVPMIAIDVPELYVRPGGPYVDEDGQEFKDNGWRFALLGCVAAHLAEHGLDGWKPDVVHAHDWQAGLTPAYLKWSSKRPVPCVATIHNLAYQGAFHPDLVTAVGLPAAAYDMHGVEFYGRFSFLKSALYYADAITTVSPTYAWEIQRPLGGMGLEGLLSSRAESLHGIVNGIDQEAWDPSTDALLPATYGPDDRAGKRASKAALQRALGLDPREDAPLFGTVARFTWQKGLDLVAEVIPRLLARGAQVAVVGSGDHAEESRWHGIAAAYPGKVGVFVGFDERMAHLVEAGSDAFLMPSRFEPCGMNQMYSQRYGTPPIVRRTGGLADTVVDAQPDTLARGAATGFVFDAPTAGDLMEACDRALAAFDDPAAWSRITTAGMRRDFSWRESARRYLHVYDTVCASLPF